MKLKTVSGDQISLTVSKSDLIAINRVLGAAFEQYEDLDPVLMEVGEQRGRELERAVAKVLNEAHQAER